MPKKHLSKEEKAEMIEYSKSIPGTLTKRSQQIAVKYHVSACTVTKIIRTDQQPVRKGMTDAEKKRILNLYMKNTEKVSDRVKIKSIVEKTGWSASSITTLLRNSKLSGIVSEPKEVYFDPKFQMF